VLIEVLRSTSDLNIAVDKDNSLRDTLRRYAPTLINNVTCYYLV